MRRPDGSGSRSRPATGPPGRACCTPPTGRSRRRPSSRWRPRGRCGGCESAEVAGLGYELVLGNTYHLFVSPGAGADRGGRRPARVHGLGAGADHRLRRLPGLLAGPRRRRRRGQGQRPAAAASTARCSRSARRACASAPTATAPSCFISPEVSMEVQAALGSDIALVFDECTPYHADRDYTARSTERTHRWLDRCLDWHARERARAARRSSGSSRAASTRTCGASRPQAVSAAGGRRDRDRRHARPRQGGDARGAGDDRAAAARRRRPSTCSGSARSTTCSPGSASASTSSTAPSRPGSPATASPSSPTPSARFRLDLRKAGWEGDRDPLVEGCPCPACRHHDRDYLSYLSRAEELTAVRLLCLHNLTYMHELTAPRPRRDRRRRVRRLRAPRVLRGRPPYVLARARAIRCSS